MSIPPAVARAFAHARLSAEDRALIDALPIADAGYGYDPFGLHRDFVGLGLAITRPLYDRYFRVRSVGAEHVPPAGPVIVAANHSGTLPTDAMMLWTDLLLKVRRPPRPVEDHFVQTLPLVGSFFARGGAVGGSRGNTRALLAAGELLMIFPEGVPGIGKPYSERYKLQTWRVGHAELAIRHRAPVVPVALVGPEEQMPQLARLEGLGRRLGLPYLPVPATPLPLPVRYRLHYGPPIPTHLDYRPEQADDPEIVREASQRVRDAVEALLMVGLRERKGRLFT